MLKVPEENEWELEDLEHTFDWGKLFMQDIIPRKH